MKIRCLYIIKIILIIKKLLADKHYFLPSQKPNPIILLLFDKHNNFNGSLYNLFYFFNFKS